MIHQRQSINGKLLSGKYSQTETQLQVEVAVDEDQLGQVLQVHKQEK
jgi:hypothetical protein